jgi:hypothetical protein
VNTASFDELLPYHVRSFTYRNEQVRADEVQRVVVYSFVMSAASIRYEITLKIAQFS